MDCGRVLLLIIPILTVLLILRLVWCVVRIRMAARWSHFTSCPPRENGNLIEQLHLETVPSARRRELVYIFSIKTKLGTTAITTIIIMRHFINVYFLVSIDVASRFTSIHAENHSQCCRRPSLIASIAFASIGHAERAKNCSSPKPKMHRPCGIRWSNVRCRSAAEIDFFPLRPFCRSQELFFLFSGLFALPKWCNRNSNTSA